MTDRVGLIRAEIKRLRKEVKDNITELGNSESERIGLFNDVEIYDNILSFIDSMQKEAKNDDLERFIYEHLWKGRMGEEIAKPIYFGYDELLAVAQSIANWQKQQMMKEADDYIVDDDNTIKRFYDTGGVVGKPIIFGSTPDSINVGDHVKVIVIKEE